ncbi:hypothetical protein [Tenacibaculum piscium]|uniref:hypothetical protein n=1 Tax=Tenacibaculum piscium TaxID=1458515 RepID=UPI001F2CAD72|nr:hypothetical protein [Tenacibaculum piscium]
MTKEIKIINNDRILLSDLQNHFCKKETSYEFEAHLRHIKEHKYLVINYQEKQYKVYSASLCYLFATKIINAKNLKTKKKFKLNSKHFFHTFIQAFEKGEEYFKNKYEALFNSNAEIIISSIHMAYYHTTPKHPDIGWFKLSNSNTSIINLKNIEDYGFYSGLVSQTDEFILEYPSAFYDFHECNSEEREEPQKIKLSIKQVALKYIYEGKHITRQNSNSIIKEYGHTSGDKLYNEYTRYSSKTNRTGNENTQKKLENKIKLIESVIPLLSIDNQEKPKKEITDLKAKLIID